MRILPAAFAVTALLEAGCAPVPPERAERDRVLLSAIEPCQRQYPAVRVVGLDDHGRLHTQISEHNLGDYEAFERCAKQALKREFELRPFGMGRLAATAGPAAVPIQTAAGAAILVPVLINGVSATLVLDTGASLTMVRPAFARRAGIEVASAAPKILGVVVGGREVSIPFVRVASVSIGAAAVESMELGVFDALPQLPEVDGLLGGNFLNHFKVTIDRENRRVSLEPARAPAIAREWRLPVWMQGDQWRLRWQSPSGGGTYVRRVEGEETVDDVAHYVVKSGSRSTYYVKATLGWHFEKAADGAITLRRTPAVAYDWPVRVGKAWELSYRREDGGGRAQELYRKCSAADETTLTVPGGVFLTLHVVCRDRAGRIAEEGWYAEEVKNWVRQRIVLPRGERIDELLSYSLERR